MKRRQFLRNGLLFGTAGSLPGAALMARQLSGDASPLTGLVLPPLNDTDLYDLLVLALKKEHLELVKSLIEQGVDVNAKGKYGKTSLYHVLWHSANTDVLEYLIARGADVNAKDDSGRTPLYEAVSCYKCNINGAKYLVLHGADVNTRDNIGCTLLHATVHCAIFVNTDIVQYLIAQGIDIHAKDMDGRTALDYAWESKANNAKYELSCENVSAAFELLREASR